MGFKSLLDHAKAYTPALALVVLLSLLSSGALLAVPWVSARLVGDILAAGETDIAGVAILLVVILLVFTMFKIAGALLAASVGSRIEADFRRDIYAHVQRLPMGFFDHSRRGDLLALLTSEVSRLSAFISGTLTAIPAALITGVGALLILFVLNPLLALIFSILLPAYYISLRVIGRRLRLLANQLQQAEARVFAAAEEDLEMLPAIKAFAREDVRLNAYHAVVGRARLLKVQREKIYAVFSPSLTLVTALGAVLLLVLASQSVADERMGATEFFRFLLYAALLTVPVGSLANLIGQLNTARGTLERLHYVLQEAREPGYAKLETPSDARGWIAFEDVWFAYRNRSDTLRGVDCDVQPGEIVALVGENGAGKSTIVKLLLGFYLPYKGRITLDGREISSLNIQELRRRIGYVPQRPLLQNGTIKDNLILNDETISDAEIEQACLLAQAHDFILDLPNAYYTQIGDHGFRLSGGQRQRLALARALISDPPILVLDEATSMFDLDGEATFVETSRTALLGRTVLIITNRPASLALADRILRIQNGRLTEVTLEDLEGESFPRRSIAGI
ncbi:ABC transporter ATP-binding protein [Aurantiacibacter hainanensis]|uniref:ABC transporter ATP-binding protein n=1 Tax=Aurantiacibacter hainanensis TaxID=3076114 RepID=UPI0030C75EB4